MYPFLYPFIWSKEGALFIILEIALAELFNWSINFSLFKSLLVLNF